MEKIVVPIGAVGIRFEEKRTPPTIQFVDSAFFPFGQRHEIAEGVEKALEILREILGLTAPSIDLHPIISYPDGARYFVIPLHRR